MAAGTDVSHVPGRGALHASVTQGPREVSWTATCVRSSAGGAVVSLHPELVGALGATRHLQRAVQHSM